MGFLKKKKKDVPDELPDLADELKEKLKDDSEESREEKQVEKPAEIKKEEKPIKEKSFFSKILDEVNEKANDLGNLENWYSDNFSGKGVVSNMKEYWKEKKDEMVMDDLKEKINQKISKMKELEKDWKETYFELMKKEEKMKEEEKELKKLFTESVYGKNYKD